MELTNAKKIAFVRMWMDLLIAFVNPVMNVRETHAKKWMSADWAFITVDLTLAVTTHRVVFHASVTMDFSLMAKSVLPMSTNAQRALTIVI